jgi:signal transduction histidine kinase
MSVDSPDFQLLFEESPDALLVLLPDPPRFTAVAATKARLVATHTTLEQTVGRGLFEMFPDNPDDPAATGTANLRASLERVLVTRAPDTMAVQKYDIPRADGTFEVKYWSPRNIPILSAAGEVSYILHRVVDVTDLVRASEEGEEWRGRTQDMEREVLRRSRELDAANRQLREANEKLSQLDSVKTAFFSNISHEFRTPLTLMLGPLEDCLSDTSLPLADLQRAQLTLAHDNALRLLKLVNALLDFSRLEAGRLRGRFAPVDLASLTRDLAGMFQTAFDKANLRLTLDCPASLGPTYVDKDIWEKVVPNLVSNAFKFTLSGGVTVRVRDTVTHTTLQVIDTGSGIPEEELPRIFERFHRVAGATGRTYEGAGIGLALVRELVELHGGVVAVQSTLGSGTEFRVEIPKGSAHLPADSVVLETAKTQDLSGIDAYATEASRWDGSESTAALSTDSKLEVTDRPRVLMVDDNADLRAYMSGLLGAHYSVVAVNDGLEALDVIRSHRPEIVLSDVMMPRMTGIELVQALRSEPGTVNLPVILLSRVRSHLKLAQARRQLTAKLELANRELDAFSYSVAHDLRGPLHVIDGFSEMLLQDYAAHLDESARRHLGTVRSAHSACHG